MLSSTLIALSAASVVLGGYIPPEPTQIFTTQPVCHQRSASCRSTDTFQQKILVYEHFWRSSPREPAQRPIIVTMGGEAPVRGGYDHNGALFQWGEALGALLVFPEHRFYGESWPAGVRTSRNPLAWLPLTVEEALADHVAVIAQVRQNYSAPDSPLVVAGGSYPGMLAAWLRAHYPHVADAALASSAPLNGGPTGAFFRVAARDVQRGDARCGDIVKRAFVDVEQAFADARQLARLWPRLRVCAPPPASHITLELLQLWIFNAFATLGMEDYPYAVGEFREPFPAESACRNVTTRFVVSQDPVQALSALTDAVYNATGDAGQCHNLSKEFLKCSDITGCGTGPDGRSWYYQSCTQLQQEIDTTDNPILPETKYSKKDIDDMCRKEWHITPDYGFLKRFSDFSNATRIVFSNGAYDPWSPYGVLQPPNTGHILTVEMQKAAHHLDLRGSDPADPLSVVQARELEHKVLFQWMSEALMERTGEPLQPPTRK